MASGGIEESSLCPEFTRSSQWPTRVVPPENAIARLPHPRKPLLKKVKRGTRKIP